MTQHYDQQLYPVRSRSRRTRTLGTMPTSTNNAARKAGNDLSSYSQRLPKPKRTGDPDADNEALLEHQAFQRLITLLENSRKGPASANSDGIIIKTLGYVQARLSKSHVSDENQFDASVTTIAKLPNSWSAAWLMATCPAITPSMVQKIARADPDGLDRLIHFSHQLPKTFQLLPECTDKRVAFRLLQKLYTRHGARITHPWVAKCIGGDGVLNWKAGGSYSFDFDEAGRATAIKHINGASVPLAEHIFISRKFSLVENWSDLAATVRFDDGPQPVKYVCIEFFPPDSKLQQEVVRKNKDRVVEALAKGISDDFAAEVQRAKSGELNIDEGLLQTPNQERKRTACEKARLARAQSEEKKKQRRVQLT